MNTNIRARKPKKIIPPPGPGVRCPSGSDLCAALLGCPILFGLLISPARHPGLFNFCSSLFNFVQHKQSFQKFPDSTPIESFFSYSAFSAASQNQ
jgi:hypothetical protein